MAPSYLSRPAKKKRIVKEDNYEEEEEDDNEVALNVIINYAEGIDDPTTYPSVNKRIYRVFGWVTPGSNGFFTREAEGFPNPIWNRNFHLELGKPTQGRFLNLEVVRFGSQSDPGTSTGMVLVGRTQIPLPKELSIMKTGRYGLVKLVEAGYKPEGYITVSMEMKKMEYDYYY